MILPASINASGVTILPRYFVVFNTINGGLYPIISNIEEITTVTNGGFTIFFIYSLILPLFPSPSALILGLQSVQNTIVFTI